MIISMTDVESQLRECVMQSHHLMMQKIIFFHSLQVIKLFVFLCLVLIFCKVPVKTAVPQLIERPLEN